jgi:fructosamine-3-kinase
VEIDQILNSLEDQLSLKTKQINSISGGDINQAFKIQCEDGSKFFVKANIRGIKGMFEAEAKGLELLSAQFGEVITPRVLGFSDWFLALEYLNGDPFSDASWAELGEKLAVLHLNFSNRFGLEFSNFIGSNPQPNRWSDNWGEFFYLDRLMFQVENLGSDSLKDLLESKRDKIIELLSEHHPKPSLVHGDLWSGNIHLCSGCTYLIDPAIYYADREVDLAMSELFGGFPSIFYQSYFELFPKCSGYEKRKNIYNLYHILNHASLFGGAYQGQSIQMLNDI